mgnify:CR=1 FL=1
MKNEREIWPLKKKYTVVCELSRVGLFVTCLFFARLQFNSSCARVRAWQFKVCTSHAVHYSYNGFKYVLKEHSCFVCNRGDTVSRQSPIKRVRPSPYTTNSVFLIPRQALSSHWHQWMVWLQDRIEILCQIGTLSTILQHCTHTQWNRDPLLLADGTLRCWI